MENLEIFTFQKANNKGADQTARMRRLVCAFVVCNRQSQGFSRLGPYDFEAQAFWPPLRVRLMLKHAILVKLTGNVKTCYPSKAYG